MGDSPRIKVKLKTRTSITGVKNIKLGRNSITGVKGIKLGRKRGNLLS